MGRRRLLPFGVIFIFRQFSCNETHTRNLVRASNARSRAEDDLRARISNADEDGASRGRAGAAQGGEVPAVGVAGVDEAGAVGAASRGSGEDQPPAK